MIERVLGPHSRGEWARDDDGDGLREVHVNTSAGLWTGVRHFLRNSRGVTKYPLRRYVAIFQWAYDVRGATVEFLRGLQGGDVSPLGRHEPSDFR
jgi:hypothetical protein